VARIVRCLATGNVVDVPDGHWALSSPEFVEVTTVVSSPPEPALESAPEPEPKKGKKK